MPFLPTTQSRLALAVASIVLASVLISCSPDPVAAPSDIRGAASALAGKSPTALAVTATTPSYGNPGTTFDVHVTGTGFTTGAQATWLLHGVADPAHVRTNSTTFVSSTEVIANVTVSGDAQLAFWDVQIALAGGKNGVGSELFEVTSAQILGAGTVGDGVTVRDMNELRQVVGWSSGAKTSLAWVYDDALGMVNLGPGEAHGIDPLGTLAIGANGSFIQTAWVRQANNTWLAEQLPRPAGSLSGMAQSAARLPDGTLFVVGWDQTEGARRSSTISRPVIWRRSGSVWSAPTIYPIPPGATSVSARDGNRLEQVVGQLEADGGIVWDTPTSYTILDAIPNRINPSGTLIVGARNTGAAVYWWRDPITHAWHTPAVELPTPVGAVCIRGLARDVNDAGFIVGWSCTSSTGEERPTVWRLDLSSGVPVLVAGPTVLPGFGVKSGEDLSSAASITEAAPYVVTGSARITTTNRVAVRWTLP